MNPAVEVALIPVALVVLTALGVALCWWRREVWRYQIRKGDRWWCVYLGREYRVATVLDGAKGRAVGYMRSSYDDRRLLFRPAIERGDWRRLP